MPRKRNVPDPTHTYIGDVLRHYGFAKSSEAALMDLNDAHRGDARAVREVWRQLAVGLHCLRPEDLDVLRSALMRLSDGSSAEQAFMPSPKHLAGLPPGPERRRREREEERSGAAESMHDLVVNQGMTVHAAAKVLASKSNRQIRWHELAYKDYRPAIEAAWAHRPLRKT